MKFKNGRVSLTPKKTGKKEEYIYTICYTEAKEVRELDIYGASSLTSIYQIHGNAELWPNGKGSAKKRVNEIKRLLNYIYGVKLKENNNEIQYSTNVCD